MFAGAVVVWAVICGVLLPIATVFAAAESADGLSRTAVHRNTASFHPSAANPQCGALVDLFNATKGPGWLRREGWTNPDVLKTSCCSAFGVVCEKSSQNVIELNLMGNNLSGSMPESISALAQLSTLYEKTLIRSF